MKAISMSRCTFPALAVLALAVAPVSAQNEQLQERVAALKQAAAANQEALTHYTWQETRTVIIKGEVKKTEKFQVRFGSDGKQLKTPIDPDATVGSGGRKHGMKHRVVEKKTAEYEEYGEKLGALAHLYAHPDPAKLQTAYQAGKITIGPSGNPDENRLVIQDYAKAGDTVTISFDQVQKVLMSVQILSYLDDPSDKANIVVKFARVPDGPGYPANIGVEGVGKQLAVGIQNSDYKKLPAQ